MAWQVERSDSQIAVAITAGMAGTPMPPAAASHAGAGAIGRRVSSHAADASQGAWPQRRSRRQRRRRGGRRGARVDLAARAVADRRAQRHASSDAGDRAFDAYIAFEPIETPARARDPGVVASMETLFTDFKGAVRANDLRGAERALRRDRVEHAEGRRR